MKVIIVPLNEYLYSYHQFDGLNLYDRIKKAFKGIPSWVVNMANNKKLNSFFDTKIGNFVLKFIFAFPVFLLIVILFIFPLHIYMIIKHGWKKAGEERNKYMEFVLNERVDITRKIDSLKKEGFELIIYYNKNRVPYFRKKFLKRIDIIKNGLKPLAIIEANESNDISLLIMEHKVDIKNSYFISDGNISITGLNNLVTY
ncbi:MAG: hypothetical protein PSX36_14135 [bacterium]|nr:hypothetical protein [bacterium]